MAGDNDTAKRTAMKLVSEAGFDPVDDGLLEDSWRQQPGTPAYCCDWKADEMKAALARAVPGRAPLVRDSLYSRFAGLGPNPTHEAVIRINRGVHEEPFAP